jgi:Phage tail assembly chaperone proteins, E, or 41 or 14
VSDTYQLKHPIVLRTKVQGGAENETTLEEVSVRRLKAKDLRMLDTVQGRMAQSLAIIAALTGLTAKAVDELDGEDVEGLGEIIGDFFPGRQEAGETS